MKIGQLREWKDDGEICEIVWMSDAQVKLKFSDESECFYSKDTVWLATREYKG